MLKLLAVSFFVFIVASLDFTPDLVFDYFPRLGEVILNPKDSTLDGFTQARLKNMFFAFEKCFNHHESTFKLEYQTSNSILTINRFNSTSDCFLDIELISKKDIDLSEIDENQFFRFFSLSESHFEDSENIMFKKIGKLKNFEGISIVGYENKGNCEGGVISEVSSVQYNAIRLGCESFVPEPLNIEEISYNSNWIGSTNLKCDYLNPLFPTPPKIATIELHKSRDCSDSVVTPLNYNMSLISSVCLDVENDLYYSPLCEEDVSADVDGIYLDIYTDFEFIKTGIIHQSTNIYAPCYSNIIDDKYIYQMDCRNLSQIAEYSSFYDKYNITSEECAVDPNFSVDNNVDCFNISDCQCLQSNCHYYTAEEFGSLESPGIGGLVKLDDSASSLTENDIAIVEFETENGLNILDIGEIVRIEYIKDSPLLESGYCNSHLDDNETVEYYYNYECLDIPTENTKNGLRLLFKNEYSDESCSSLTMSYPSHFQDTTVHICGPYEFLLKCDQENYDVNTKCTECIGNYDIADSCNSCLNNWYGKDCLSCDGTISPNNTKVCNAKDTPNNNDGIGAYVGIGIGLILLGIAVFIVLLLLSIALVFIGLKMKKNQNISKEEDTKEMENIINQPTTNKEEDIKNSKDGVEETSNEKEDNNIIADNTKDQEITQSKEKDESEKESQ